MPCGALGASAAGAEPPFTETFALAVALPPAPVAVIVNVVDCVGFTGVEPCGETLPTPGSMSRSVAFVDDHESVTVPPGLTDDGEAFSVTVGCKAGAGAAAGGVPATFFLQPPAIKTRVTRPNSSVSLRRELRCMNCLLRRRREGLAGSP